MNIPSAFGKNLSRFISSFSSWRSWCNCPTQVFSDPLQTQKGREKAAKKMAVDTSGLELSLPIDTTVPRGQLGPNPIIGQTLKEREDTLRNLRERKSEIDEFAIGTGKDETAKTTEGADVTSSPKFTDPEAEAAKKAQDQKDAMETAGDEDLDYTDTYTEEELKAVNDPEVKKKAAQAELFTAMKEIEDIYGDDSEPKKRKTIDDYKADFAKATGIDISGEPDNKSALMALGLSLMQNRAGKGFNLSNILGEVGAAGQAALPKFEEARKEARAAQVAAGKVCHCKNKKQIKKLHWL